MKRLMSAAIAALMLALLIPTASAKTDDALVSRAELANILYRASGSPEVAYEACFSDVEADGLYSGAVCWASENEIVNGYPDGRFLPDQEVTRQEFAAMAYRAAGTPATGDAAPEFSDGGDVAPFAQDAIIWAVQAGLLRQTEDSAIAPLASVTGADAVAVLPLFHKDAFQEETYTGSNGATVLYRLRKGTDEGQPLVLWQHGSGAVGTDNQKQLTANNNAAYVLASYSPEWSVLAAQYPYKFTTPYEDGQEKELTDWLAAYDELVQSLIADGTADADRVYIAGGSMGGGIVMEYITRYPDRFAAAAAMCPRGTISEEMENLERLDEIAALPLWLFHTEGDATNDKSISDNICGYLVDTAKSETVKYTEYTASDMEAVHLDPLYSHNASWMIPLLYSGDTLPDWLMAQSRAE